MLTIYSYGCTSCGLNGMLIRKIQKFARDNHKSIKVINSKYNENDRQDHAVNLSLAGIDRGSYPSIVVQGKKITELRKWQPSI